MIYRATGRAVVQIPPQKEGGTAMRYAIVEDKEYDDSDPVVAVLVERFPQYFRADNVESATAGPGEKRNTRRGQ